MKRSKAITEAYLNELNNHLDELKAGKVTSTFEVKDIAALLHIHPTHLSNTIQEELKRSPGDIYEEGLMEIARELILTTNHSIAEIARQLTFDPSNFNKFFKHFAGTTPKKFRDAHAH